MANVDSTVTPTTAIKVERSLSRVGDSTEEMAMAAEAPQMPTAPPDKKPSDAGRLKARANKRPEAMVRQTANTKTKPTLVPKCVTWFKVMRTPNSATPNQSTVRAQKLMPSLLSPWPYKK